MGIKSFLFNSTISNTLIFTLLLIFLFFSLIPILGIAKYNVPSADDFSFSCETHKAVMENQSLFGLCAAALNKVQDVYISWQGTFSAVFMMALQPSIWGFQYYSLTTPIMLISLLGGIFFFCFRLFSGLFHISKAFSGIIASVISIIYTQFVPLANQSFYWYNGSVYYTFTFGLMLIFYAVYIGYILHKGIWRIIILCILSFILGGSNYVTALLSLIISLSIILLLLIKRDNKWTILLIPCVFLFVSFAFSILAPGNAVRQSSAPDHPGPVQAIVLSFRYGFINLTKWTDFRFLACILFLVPFLYNAAGHCQSFSFPFPLLFSVFSLCLYSSSFTPHLFALGSDGPERLKNIIYFLYVLLTVLNLFWWFGWITHKKHKQSCSTNVHILPFILFSTGTVISIFCAVFIFHQSLTTVLAINELKSGEAREYYEEAMQRQIILEDPSILDCEFKPFEHMPYLLFFTDMSDDPSDFQNEDTCTYYQKNTILVR